MKMSKVAIPLALAAAATLAACGGPSHTRSMDSAATPYVAPAGTAVSAQGARAGWGRIVYLVDPTGPIDGISDQHLTLQMADGSMQQVTTRGPQYALGQSVQVR